MASPFRPLAPGDEDALHRARLLATEERAFKRITKRLLGSELLAGRPSSALPTPPPEGSGEDAQDFEEEDCGAVNAKVAEEYRKFRDDVLSDFSAFEANIMRTQLLLNSNGKERERYEKEKLRIQETAQSIRQNTSELREQLAEAQQTLERRKGWDRLAEKITNNRMLRTREEQQANIEKLNFEIAELEQESRDYAATWAERRQQFGRIVDEGMQMLRLIRDEKEEVERREGMEDQEEGDDGDSASARGRISAAGTPRPDGAATPLHLGPDAENADGRRDRSPARPSSGLYVEPPGKATDTQTDIDMADEGEVEDDIDVSTNAAADT